MKQPHDEHDLMKPRTMNLSGQDIAQLLLGIADMTSDGVVSVDDEQRIVYFNHGAEQIFACKADDMIGKDLHCLMPGDRRQVHQTHMKHFKQNKIDHVVKGIKGMVGLRSNGEEFPMQGSLFKQMLSGKLIMTIILRDVSQYESIQTDLRTLSNVVGQSPSNVIITDPDGCIEFVNQAFTIDTGFSREDALGNTPAMLKSGLTDAGTYKAMWDSIHAGRHWKGELQNRNKNGDLCWYSVSISPIKDDAGVTTHLVAVQTNIQRRRENEQQIDILSHAIEQAGEAILITNRKSEIEYVNPAFLSLTGYDEHEVIGKNPRMLKSDAQNHAFYENLWKTISRGDVWRGSMVDRRKDGTFYPALMTISPILNKNHEITHFVAIQKDMSAYNELEEKFLQAQKMETLGTLLGGVAHDFNNILNAIMANTYMAKLKLEADERACRHIDDVEKMAFRAADLIHQLLAFARNERIQMKRLPLNAFLKETFKMSKSALSEAIHCIYTYPDHDMCIMADGTQLQQVIMNLINNARDAVQDVPHPEITVSLEEYCPSMAWCKRHAAKQGAYTLLTVSDNGCGISGEILNKIYDPFFTTKGVGKGTGLGLSMVYAAVKAHEGKIELETEQGLGTVFRLYFPLLEMPVEAATDNEDATVTGNGEIILIVEDEPEVLDSLAEQFIAMNYRVLTAENGEKALEIFTKHSDEIDIIISDIVMPEMDGVKLRIAIDEIRSNFPVILITGYDQDGLALEDNLPAHTRVMDKPFTAIQISRVIDELLHVNQSSSNA